MFSGYCSILVFASLVANVHLDQTGAVLSCYMNHTTLALSLSYDWINAYNIDHVVHSPSASSSWCEHCNLLVIQGTKYKRSSCV